MARVSFLGLWIASAALLLCSSCDGGDSGATMNTGAPSSSVDAPSFSTEGGFHSRPLGVTLSCATTGASIHVTTDGTVPTSSSTLYTGPITVVDSMTITAIAVKEGATSAVSRATYSIIPWNRSITYGSFVDTRDGQEYRTVVIGKQTWMAENLNFKPAGADSGWCYDDRVDGCVKYGRLYSWTSLMQGAPSSEANPSGVQGICPAGWHVPSEIEWNTLARSVGGASAAGPLLKSASGWSEFGSGTDAYGFRALPGGQYGYGDAGYVGYWWSTTEGTGPYAWGRRINYDLQDSYLTGYNSSKSSGFSVRCVGR